jgi:hypothetical protein
MDDRCVKKANTKTGLDGSSTARSFENWQVRCSWYDPYVKSDEDGLTQRPVREDAVLGQMLTRQQRTYQGRSITFGVEA